MSSEDVTVIFLKGILKTNFTKLLKNGFCLAGVATVGRALGPGTRKWSAGSQEALGLAVGRPAPPLPAPPPLLGLVLQPRAARTRARRDPCRAVYTSSSGRDDVRAGPRQHHKGKMTSEWEQENRRVERMMSKKRHNCADGMTSGRKHVTRAYRVRSIRKGIHPHLVGVTSQQ